jgi:hypothetical protein
VLTVRWRWVFAALVAWSADWIMFVFLYQPVGRWVLAVIGAAGWLLAAVGLPLMRLPAVTAALAFGAYAAAVAPAVTR